MLSEGITTFESMLSKSYLHPKVYRSKIGKVPLHLFFATPGLATEHHGAAQKRIVPINKILANFIIEKNQGLCVSHSADFCVQSSCLLFRRDVSFYKTGQVERQRTQNRYDQNGKQYRLLSQCNSSDQE